MKILGIDQSYTSAGYCIIDDNEEVIDFGTIRTSVEDGDIFNRARIITNKIKKIAEEHAVDVVGLEGLAFGGFGSATRDLAGLQFLIVDSFRPTKIEIIVPTSVKKLAVGKIKRKIIKQDLVDALPEKTKNLFLERGLKKSKGLFDVTDSYWISVYTKRNKT